MSNIEKKPDGMPNRRGGGAHGPGGPMMMPAEKAKNFKGTFKRLAKYLAPFRTSLMVVVVFAVLSTGFAIWSPQITRIAMNDIQDAFVAKSVIKGMTEFQQGLSDAVEGMKSGGAASSGGVQPTMAEMQALQTIMKQPKLQDLKTNDEIADTVTVLLAELPKLSGLMASMQENSDATGDKATIEKPVSMTDEQLEAAVLAIRETGGHVNKDDLIQLALILAGMYLLSSAFTLVMQLMMSGLTQRTVYGLRKEVDAKLERLPLKYFDGRTHGEILSRMTNDVDTISQTLQQSLTQMITSVISILGYIIMMLTISPLLTLIVMVTMPMYVFATVGISKRSQKYFAAQQKHLGKLSGHVEEMFSGHKIVKAFGKERDSLAIFEVENEALYVTGWKAQFISGIMFPLMNFIGNISYVLISVVGGLWITANKLKIGDITSFITYSRSFTMPIVQTANIANIIQSTIACAERVFEVLDETEEVPEATEPVVLSQPRGEVDIHQVNFRYQEETPLIENMNLSVKQGHTVAIVGPTGAGKTTLVNLLMRFYELNGGSMTIDGVDLRDMRRGDLRSMFGMVLQDTWLFNGTIREVPTLSVASPVVRKQCQVISVASPVVRKQCHLIPSPSSAQRNCIASV
jgi:ATP-binding cassette, subfamily B, multidrug efflux pump